MVRNGSWGNYFSLVNVWLGVLTSSSMVRLTFLFGHGLAWNRVKTGYRRYIMQLHKRPFYLISHVAWLSNHCTI